MKRWTAHDDARLAQLYPHHSHAEIGRLLGRTVRAVTNRAHLLGLRTPPKGDGKTVVAERPGLRITQHRLQG